MNKPKLNISLIGKARFYIGIIVSTVLLVIIVVINNIVKSEFNHEYYRIYPDYLLNFAYYFGVAAYASGVAILIWFRNNKNNFARWWQIKLGKINIWIFLIIFFSIVFRGDPDLLNRIRLNSALFPFTNYIYWMYLLVPVVLFLNNWTMIRISFRCKNFLLINLIVCLFFGIISLLIFQ